MDQVLNLFKVFQRCGACDLKIKLSFASEWVKYLVLLWLNLHRTINCARITRHAPPTWKLLIPCARSAPQKEKRFVIIHGRVTCASGPP